MPNSPRPDWLPPGPPDPPLVQAFRFHRDPLGNLTDLRNRYGDVVGVRFPYAGPAAVVFKRSAVRSILESDPGSAHGGDARRGILGMVSDKSVLGADGAVHRHARSVLSEPFEAESLDRARPLMTEIISRHVESWPRSRPFRLLPKMRLISDEIFVRVVLGVMDNDRADALTHGITKLIQTPGNPPTFVPAPEDGVLGKLTASEFARRVRHMNELLAPELEARRAAEDPGPGIIGAVIEDDPGITVQQFSERILPVCMAGQEPIASALTWLADSAHRRGWEPGRDDPLEDPFVKESFRLRPPVHSVGRTLTSAREIGGHELPAGTTVLVPIVALHRDPVAYPDAGVFRPERFGEAADELPYLPFGGGARRCLGENLARAEIASVLPAVRDRVRLRFAGRRSERMVVRGTILVPRFSAVVTAGSR